MVQLVSQRRQRPAARPANHDLPDQVTGQRLGQHAAWHPQQLGRRLPGAGDAGSSRTASLRRSPPAAPPAASPARPAPRLAGSRKTSLTTIASCSSLLTAR